MNGVRCTAIPHTNRFSRTLRHIHLSHHFSALRGHSRLRPSFVNPCPGTHVLPASLSLGVYAFPA
ncbi:uncharacterized protein B0H18DRAFT_999456 [Fomitopsis serialis]|uniref:uncharacterized protein n=1 Tax=Fomitopsis serialis TaxID=139415 RepID=UPI002007508D|nr:uncharacterized protein B0H18DRAFT_999456 [Neoantrodia serialis]KAH9928933.1 hypothetical protein B0H18DRAFT_999456 [Neoantrodia serialis]